MLTRVRTEAHPNGPFECSKEACVSAKDERDSEDAATAPTSGLGARDRMSRRSFLGAGGAVVALAGCTGPPGRRSPTSPTTSSTKRSPTSPSPNPADARPPAEPSSSGRAAASGTTGALPDGPAHEVMRGAGIRREVALTFHGAGDPDLASAVLTTVRSDQAAMTVMAVGTWLASNPQIAETVLAGGHELGNHTWAHPVLRDLSRTRAREEIERCREELVRLTGSPGRWFRQSGSQHSTALIRELAGAAGYPVCLSYDVDSMDWTDPGPASIVRNVRAAKAGSIVSLHLGHRGTLDALPAILRSLRARGLRPVTVTTLLAA